MRERKIRLIGVLEVLLPMLALFAGLLIMHFLDPSVQQASLPVPMKMQFLDEYSWDRETWYPLTEDTKLSAFEGDLYLRGGLEHELYEQARLYYFSNHIGVEMFVGEDYRRMDIIMELKDYNIDIQTSMCRSGWAYMYIDQPIPSGTEVELHLTNPHSFGNKSAYNDFLSTMYCTNDDSLFISEYFKDSSRIFVAIGAVLAIAAIMLLGAAAASIALRVPIGYTLMKFGLLAGFTGAYYIFDTLNLSFWSDNNILNTYGLQVSMMYAVYMLGIVSKDMLEGRTRQIAAAALVASGILNAGIVLISFTGRVLIYDTLIYWVISQLILCPLLIICCLKNIPHMSRDNKISAVFLVVVLYCVFIDILWTPQAFGVDRIMTKLAFVASFVYVFARSTKSVIVDYMASKRAEKLENELEESRISVMLSQIQPHFMFNVLGTLRGLCREDPEQAWEGLGDFSKYLRGNMDALTNAKYIRFETELQHVETYLRLEKMRLGNRLSIVYDIEEKNFSLPPLTLQPLVENAVKHGIFYKKTGGTVIIHTWREGNKINISVQDDGVGFNTERAQPGFEQHAHVGMANVRSRVEKMMGGTLTVESVPDQGTTVTVAFPVSEKEQGGEQT